jgi:tetratricopeptide (TPR) repeat protein
MRSILITILVLCSMLVVGQNVSYYVKKGEAAFRDKNYALAGDYFLRAIEINPNIVRIQYKYAESLRNNHDYEEAARWYRKVFRSGEHNFPLARFHYATAMKMLGEYDSAYSGYHRFYKLNRLNEALREYVLVSSYEKRVCERLKERDMFLKTKEVRLLDEPFSSEYGEFSPVQLDSSRILISTFREFQLDSIRQVANGILLLHLDNDQHVISIDTLLTDIQYNYSIGSGSTAEHIYFSRCPMNDSIENCKIFSAEISDNKITGMKEVPGDVNLDGTDSRHPCYIQFDGEAYLLFASNRAGGFGKHDIWYSKRNSEGEFLECRNAGRFINSMENELSPFFYVADTVLYFSSTWHGSNGGYDIYGSYGNFSFWTSPVNEGVDINTSYDDLYYIVNPYTRMAHFVSSRKKDKFKVNCCHDIYRFDLPFSKNDSIREIQRVARLTKRKELIRTELRLLTPLDIYFQNDTPDPGSRDTVTMANLLNLLVDYVDVFDDYHVAYTDGLSGRRKEKASNDMHDFFVDHVEVSMDDLNQFASLLEQALRNGDKIKVSVQAFTSPLNNKEYNKNLAKRRIVSLLNFLNNYENGTFVPYLRRGSLIIEQVAYGESKSPDFLSDDIGDLRNSVYSPLAAKERRIQIQAVSVNGDQ